MLTRKLLWTMAIGTGVAVANLYYSQPLLGAIARDLDVGVGAVSAVPMLSQLGYAEGLFLFVPLGDAVERRGQIVWMSLATAVACVGVAAAHRPAQLLAASFALGAATVAPQLLVPFAAHLARPEERGRVVGLVMGGLLVGILLARTVSGWLGAVFGWRAMYLLAAGLMLVLAALLRALLPQSRPPARVRVRELWRSLFALARSQPVLREAAVLGGLAFGAFSAFWTTLVFLLESPAYGMGSRAAGLFGLVGMAGALAAPLAGGFADRRGARFTAGLALATVGASWLVLLPGASHLWALVAGVVLLDLGVQANHISNQARIYALDPAARGRLNTVYMVTYFVGGALGTWAGARAFVAWQWRGVCATGVLFALAALAVFAGGARRKV